MIKTLERSLIDHMRPASADALLDSYTYFNFVGGSVAVDCKALQVDPGDFDP
jgi:hypothetical protein